MPTPVKNINRENINLDHAETLPDHPVHEVEGGAGDGHGVVRQLVWRRLGVTSWAALKC